VYDSGSDGTFTAIHGNSSAVQSNNSGSGAVTYTSLQQQQLHDGVNNVGGARPGRQTDTGIYRPSSYGPRAPAPKTGLHSPVDSVTRAASE